MPRLTKADLEAFCYRIKDAFGDNVSGRGHYDKQDLMDDLTDFLREHGIEVEE